MWLPLAAVGGRMARLTVRLSDELSEALKTLAKSQRTTPAALAKNFISDGVSGFKETTILMELIELQSEGIEQAKILASAALAANATLLVDRAKTTAEISQSDLKETALNSFALGAEYLKLLKLQMSKSEGKK